MLDSWKTFGQESKASCRLISSITQKDEGAILYGFPVIQHEKIRIPAQLRANLAHHRLAKR